jgi:hypothetical protein
MINKNQYRRILFWKVLNSLENKEQGSDSPRANDNLQDMLATNKTTKT